MPPMPHVNGYRTASRLILAGCRCRKTFERIASERLRGSERSCETRKIDFQSCVSCGSLYSFASSIARCFRAWLPSFTRSIMLRLSSSPAVSCFFSSFGSVSICVSDSDICAIVVKVARLAFGPRGEFADVHHYLAFSIDRDLRTIHRARRRALKVNAFTVVATAMARALKLVFACLPVGRAAEMSTASVDDKETVGSSRHPDTILLLPLGIDAECVVIGRPDTKNAGRFENRARQKEPHEHQEERD